MFLSETYLDSQFPVNDENVVIQGCDLVRCDHLFNTKHGRVFICYKSSSLLKIANIHFWQECINYHLIIGDKICHFITL